METQAGRQREIKFRFSRLTRLFHYNFNDKILTQKKERTRKLSCHYRCNGQRLQKIFPQVNKNLIDLFESLPQVLANNKENNTDKSYIKYFIKWKKWANQFTEVNVTPVEKIYVILYMLSRFQNNKSYPFIRISHYAIKYFNEFFSGGRELASDFITKVLEGIKRLYGHTENTKSLLSSSDLKRVFQYLGGVEMNLTNLRFMMILVLSFMSFLRFSELSILERSDFILHNTRMSTLIEKNKTDIYRIDPTKFPLHSLRSGAALAAAKLDENDRLFKNHGRWKLDKVKDRYRIKTFSIKEPTISFIIF